MEVPRRKHTAPNVIINISRKLDLLDTLFQLTKHCHVIRFWLPFVTIANLCLLSPCHKHVYIVAVPRMCVCCLLVMNVCLLSTNTRRCLLSSYSVHTYMCVYVCVHVRVLVSALSTYTVLVYVVRYSHYSYINLSLKARLLPTYLRMVCILYCASK